LAAKTCIRERGQVLPVIAIMLASLLAIVGLAIDLGRGMGQRTNAQKAADAAALAGAAVLAEKDDAASAEAEARDFASQNGFSNAETIVNIPPTSGPHAGDPDYIEVRLIRTTNTTFMRVVGIDEMDVAGRAVGWALWDTGGEFAIFANETSCGVSDALEFNGSNVNITGDVHSNSHLKVPGSNNDFDGDTSHMCGVQNSGSGNTYESGSPHVAPVKTPPVSYDYSDFTAVPCTRTWSSDVDLSSVANVWVGNNPASKELKPGLYCSTGKIQLSGSDVTGQVTLASQSGQVQVSGSNFDLTPYWQGVLMYTQWNDSSAIDLSGSGGEWTGLIIAPNGKVKIAGSSNFTLKGSVIADQVQVSGSDFNLTALAIDPGLEAVRLVE
jgi:hypothetical protein